ncbi:alpha/beta fold hydrolase [Methylobacterium sp. NFXW15]|uniref:alpha/beta fold hydrolase n=1 Tax=Methylobacterium sp. NFXW15 TaxID=2819512 RepID=UPI003CEB685E
MRITLAGGRIAAQVSGAGEPLVLFHSLLADAASFDRIAGPLAERFRVIVPDLPGFGGSEAVSGGLEVVADRMAEAVRDLGEQPSVLGNGFGGFVALQMAIRHPGLARRLILADCGACFSEPGRQAFRTMAAVSREKGLGALSETAMRRLFAPDFQAANPALMRERLAAFLRTDPSVFRAACEALAGLDLRPDLKAVEVPVLVLVGEQDEATPPPMSRELAAGLPEARLTILPGCAHVPQLQEPERFLEALVSFLDEGSAVVADERVSTNA